MNRRHFLSSLAAAALPSAVPAQSKRPNIIVILSDDMGFSDVGCYGGEIETPNLDRLAKGGIRFTQFYNTARCCPTRASLLTGLYPHQAGVGHMVGDYGEPGYRGNLNRTSVTIAEALRDAGYRTAMAGKWHVTPANNDKHNWPLQRGFERYYGTITGAGNFFNPATLVRDNEPAEPDRKDFYYTDALSDYAARTVRELANGQQPYFLYLAYTAAHWPLHAKPRDIEKYKDRYRGGWDELRAERHKRMIEMGLVDKRWPLTPRDAAVPAWRDAPNKDWEARRMAVYAAMVDCMDQGIGRIMSAVRETGTAEDTLVLFLQDNGGCAEEFRPTDARTRSAPKTTRDGRPVRSGNNPEIMPGPEDTFQSYGVPWANASNTPFRLYKHWVHEGGISTPLIAHWPAGVRKSGSMNSQPGHLIDIMATCLDAAGAKYPGSYEGNRITPLEGRSLVPVFRDGRRQGHHAIYWEHEGNRAVRAGKWKLVSRYPDQWELYDLDADRTEMTDLASRNETKGAELERAYNAWAKRANVVPWNQLKRG
jgi:arylsulfatase